MKRFTKIAGAVTICMIFIIRCGDKKTASRFDELLAQAPYARVTDSIKKFPENDELYFRRAVLLNTSNLPEAALADFKMAWAVNKKEKYALGISTILSDTKNEGAVRFIKEAMAELPKSILLKIALIRVLKCKWQYR